jgi:hypothetical protein
MTKLLVKLKRADIKIFTWEYWPIWLVYLPASFYYLYLAIKARSFFFFSATNPSIENGGMFFESKSKIFDLIPTEFYPKTIYIDETETYDMIVKKMDIANLQFPVIAKPDRGERGIGVKKIYSTNDLDTYRNLVKVPFLIQEYIDYPLELSVFYSRLPSEKKGRIISVALKELLSVTGDGRSKTIDLIHQNDRAFLQVEKIKKDPRLNLYEVLKKGEKKILVPYGNHSLGAMFLNYNHIIDDELVETFEKISQQIKGFYFGRFDLRCISFEDLKIGKNIAILELNGAGAEPAHIYDPNFSFFKAQIVLINYFKEMYLAASQNHKSGVPYMTFKEFRNIRKAEKEFKQKIKI